MPIYNINFKTEDLDFKQNLHAKNLENLVEKLYPLYKLVLHHIWKNMESDIKMQAKPHYTFSVSGYENEKLLEEGMLEDIFFEKRVKIYKNSSVA